MMMSTEEYSAWLASRKGKRKAKKPPAIAKLKPPAIPVTTFLDWLAQQRERTDLVGVLARDVQSEIKRLGKPLSHLNDRFNLIWYCDQMVPRSLGLSGQVARTAWYEWLASEQEEEAARSAK
jgi:hypothetical protein